MKKKYLLCIFALLAFLTLVGCSKKKEEKKEEEEVEEQTTIENGHSCKKDYNYQTLEYIAVVDEEKLTSFNIISSYQYDNVDSLKKSCTNNKEEAKETNAKNIYVTYKVKCDEKTKTISIEKDYDTEKSMKEETIKDMLSYVYEYIKEDGKFDLEGWKESNTKLGFTCE